MATKRFEGEDGKVKALVAARVEWKKDGTADAMAKSRAREFEMKADLVLLAMGFVGPVQKAARGIRRGEGRARQRQGRHRGAGCYATSCPRCLPPATCAAASRWWSGRSAKAASARAPSTNS